MDLDWTQIFYNLYHMGIAYVFALPIAFNREKDAKSAGLRTFPLVSVGACSYILTVSSVLDTDDAKARIVYGIITGIGFIGGGAILKQKGEVAGTATAASIWCTGVIGIAVAWNKFEIAILLSLINYLTFFAKGISFKK